MERQLLKEDADTPYTHRHDGKFFAYEIGTLEQIERPPKSQDDLRRVCLNLGVWGRKEGHKEYSRRTMPAKIFMVDSQTTLT